MKWITLFLIFISGCAPISWNGTRYPSSTNVDVCNAVFNQFAEHTALTPFEKRTQVLFEEMLNKKSNITYQELMRFENQAELFELLESINLKYGLPEIDFVTWIKEHREKDLKELLKIFKKFETEKNISTNDVQKMTLKLYRLLNGHQPIYKKIPFYSNLKEMFKTSSDEKILEAIRTKIWIEGLNDHVKTLGRYKNPSTMQKILNTKRWWNNQTKITLAAIIEAAQYSLLGELTPIYVPGLKLFDYKKITAEILENVQENGWKNTKNILEKKFEKSLVLDRYYNLLTYVYNRTYWIYLGTTTSIVIYDHYQEQKNKKIELEKAQAEIESLIGDLGNNLDEILAPKNAGEQADDFAKTLIEAGLSDTEVQALRQKYLEASDKVQEETIP